MKISITHWHKGYAVDVDGKTKGELYPTYAGAKAFAENNFGVLFPEYYSAPGIFIEVGG